MRKIIGWMLALALIICGGSALAGQGDVALMSPEESEAMTGNLQNAVIAGNKVYLFIQGMMASLRVYDLETGETQDWDLQDMTDRMRGLAGAEETAETGAEEKENWIEDVHGWFALEGEVYGIVSRSLYGEGESRLDGGHVRKLILADGKADLEEKDSYTLDWTGMTETAGSWVSSRYMNNCAAQEGKLYTSTWDSMGNQTLQIFDLATGEMQEKIIPDMNDFALTADGRILISQYRWGEESAMLIQIYDPESEGMEELARFSLEEGSISLFAWQPETDTIYYLRNGEIFAAANRDLTQAQAVNACPANGHLFAPMTADGRLLVWNYDTAALRSVDPALRSQVSIRIRPYTWTQGLDGATYGFAAEHPEISVIREDYGDENTLLQAMMNRDSSVDVYLISLESSAFSAILERGFAADLSGEERLNEAVDKMYPFVRETLSRNGKLMAIPLSLSGEALSYREEAMEKLGVKAEEMPRTWDQYLDFLAELPEKLAGKEIRPFELYTYREDLVLGMTQKILTQYTLTREDAAMNSEELRALLGRLQAIDFEALGILTGEEIERMSEEGGFQEMEALLSPYGDVTIGAYQPPLMLALGEGEDPAMPVSMGVAFVNPYSEHPQEAKLFLESLINHLDTTTRYSLEPELSEPMRYPYHEETRAYLEKYMAMARRNLEAAEDEETKENWQGILEDYEKTLAEFDESNWMISPEGIARYRARAAYLRPVTWNFYSAIYNMEGGDQFWQLQSEFAEGKVSPEELLSYIDKKVRMMRLEDY